MSASIHNHAGPHASSERNRRVRAFSLIELMVAIVILGLGLVMVATVFPIAWGRARTLSEQTTQATITQVAHTQLSMLASVDGFEEPGDDEPKNAATFAGDLVIDAAQAGGNPVLLLTFSDTRVHYLCMDNVSVAPRHIVPDLQVPWIDNPSTAWNDASTPWLLERVRLAPSVSAFPDTGLPANVVCGAVQFGTTSFLRSRIRLEQRVHPPLPARQFVNPSGAFIDSDPTWDEMFDGRRFAMGVFHRLRERIGPDPSGAIRQGDTDHLPAALDARGSLREFDIYYVTLRRPKSTLRFAQQDRDPLNVPDPWVPDAPPVAPKAASYHDDVLLPEPWRVQVEIATDTLNTAATATGIPTEIRVPPSDLTGAPPEAVTMLIQMFQRKTFLIDELSGQVYRVTKRRLLADGTAVYLTLDRELTVEDVDSPEEQMYLDAGNIPGNYDIPLEAVRTVWVFPPPAATRTRPEDVYPQWDGPQPVVGIDIRPLSVAPSG